MQIKTIAVILDDTRARETLIDYAAALARDHGAHLTAILQPSDDKRHEASASYARGHAAISDYLRHQESRRRIATEETRLRLDAAVARGTPSYDLRVLDRNEGAERKAGTLHADLVVAAPPSPDQMSDVEAADVLQLTTGVPFLLVPPSWTQTTPPANVLLAWNASREARRAAGDAMELLAKSTSTTVLLVDPPEKVITREKPGVEVARYLLHHNVRLTVDGVPSKGQPIAKLILDYAERNDHDLIVLGAYSHARSRELLLGGVTRFLLQNSPIPLFISH